MITVHEVSTAIESNRHREKATTINFNTCECRWHAFFKREYVYTYKQNKYFVFVYYNFLL